MPSNKSSTKEYIAFVLKSCPILFTLYVFCRLLLSGLFLVETYVFADLLSSVTVIAADQKPELSPFLTIILIWVLKWLLKNINDINAEKIKLAVQEKVILWCITKKSKLPFETIESNETQELFERIQDDPSEKLWKGISNYILLFELLLKAAILSGIVLTKSLLAASILLVLLIPYCYLNIKNGLTEYEAYEESSALFRRADYYKRILSNRDNSLERKLFGYNDEIGKRWRKCFKEASEVENHANRKVFSKIAVINQFSIIIVGIVALIMLFPLREGLVGTELYISIIKSMIVYIEEVETQAGSMISGIVEFMEYLKDFSLFDKLRETKSDNHKQNNELNQIDSIEFINVIFSYPGSDVKVFDGLNLKLDGSCQYAIVGENGAGKSTLISLLTGFYENYEGIIKINGKDIKDYGHDELCSYFSIVYQDFAKYEIPVRDFLGSGQTIGYDDIKETLKGVGFSQLVKEKEMAEKPLGHLEKGGFDLSGGQWQLLSLSRCLLSKAPVHILDEPTSAIDPVHEMQLYNSFKNRLRSKFAIYITHRFGAAMIADRIIVLSNGKVAEIGTHTELLKRNGAYRKMYEAQVKWYEEAVNQECC
ncbi:MAG: ABC transporter ATP-binding protein/permease [Lachnospiraceae bacterium]|nr:ABC transporter ATP-binding protein/permease [Lachnospiraceae bacterium]